MNIVTKTDFDQITYQLPHQDRYNPGIVQGILPHHSKLICLQLKRRRLCFNDPWTDLRQGRSQGGGGLMTREMKQRGGPLLAASTLPPLPPLRRRPSPYVLIDFGRTLALCIQPVVYRADADICNIQNSCYEYSCNSYLCDRTTQLRSLVYTWLASEHQSDNLLTIQPFVAVHRN